MGNFLNIEKCPVCDSDDIFKILSATDYLVTKEQFSILECRNCTLRFTSPIPDVDNIKKYYKSDEYISHLGKGNSIINKLYKIVQKITLRSKKRKIEKIINGKVGSLLDIGCGTGDFLNKMKLSGWKVGGVEVNENARLIAEKTVGISINSPNSFLKSNEKYDVITMWHSLEHLYDLKNYVIKIDNSLNENGLLVIAVPNYQSTDAKYYKENWAAYDGPRHLYHFSYNAMEKLFFEYGYKILSYSQLPFDPFYVSLLSEISVKGNKNIIIAMCIGLKSYLQGCRDARNGSSILYILKKDL